MGKLKPCFCGASPKELSIVDNGQGSKWASAYCDKCGEWSIEFRTDYNDLTSRECRELANEAWNSAPRDYSQLDSGC